MLFDQHFRLGAVVLDRQTVGRVEIDVLDGDVCIAVQQLLHAKLVIVERRVDQSRVAVLVERESQLARGPCE